MTLVAAQHAFLSPVSEATSFEAKLYTNSCMHTFPTEPTENPTTSPPKTPAETTNPPTASAETNKPSEEEPTTPTRGTGESYNISLYIVQMVIPST